MTIQIDIKSTVTTHDYNNVVGIKGYMSDVNYSVPHVNDDISCSDSMSCLYDENGKSCQLEGRINNDEPIAYFSYSTTTTNDNDDSGNHLHSCEGTVVNEDDNSTSASSDANADTTCVSVTPNECRKSGVFPSCYLRYICADLIARHPQYLTGNIATTTEEESSDYDYNGKETTSTMAEEDLASSYHPVQLLLLLIILPSIIIVI